MKLYSRSYHSQINLLHSITHSRTHLPVRPVSEMTYELNPRGSTEAVNASTCFAVSLGDLPRYALTYSFLILNVMSERGRS